jgi:hypothetical protein
LYGKVGLIDVILLAIGAAMLRSFLFLDTFSPGLSSDGGRGVWKQRFGEGDVGWSGWRRGGCGKGWCRNGRKGREEDCGKDLLGPLTGEGSGIIPSEPGSAVGFAPAMIGLGARLSTEREAREAAAVLAGIRVGGQAMNRSGMGGREEGWRWDGVCGTKGKRR